MGKHKENRNIFFYHRYSNFPNNTYIGSSMNDCRIGGLSGATSSVAVAGCVTALQFDSESYFVLHWFGQPWYQYWFVFGPNLSRFSPKINFIHAIHTIFRPNRKRWIVIDLVWYWHQT